MKGECCSQKTVFFAVATAIWAWGFDFVVHGRLLREKYEALAGMLRPEAEMMEMWWACIAYHLVMGGLVASAYLCWRQKITVGAVGSAECPYRKSMGFGLWVGLLLGVPQLMTYMWLPLETAEMPIAWAVSEIVKWTLAGFLLAKLYERKVKTGK